MKTLVAMLIGMVAAWILFGATDEPEVPTSPEVVAAQQAAAVQAEQAKVQAEWDGRVHYMVGETKSWCEPSTGNRIYWTRTDGGMAVSQNDDSCPQPNPQLVLPGKP